MSGSRGCRGSAEVGRVRHPAFTRRALEVLSGQPGAMAGFSVLFALTRSAGANCRWSLARPELVTTARSGKSRALHAERAVVLVPATGVPRNRSEPWLVASQPGTIARQARAADRRPALTARTTATSGARGAA